MEVKWTYLGLVSYNHTFALMDKLRTRLKLGEASEQLLLLQHKPVITRGNREKTDQSGLVISRETIEKEGVQIVDTDRGGLTTFHGPGQLVGYLILDLNKRKLKLKDFVMAVAEVLQLLLDSYGIEAGIDESMPGLFVDGEKIAFMGFNAKGNITSHGFSLNVNSDLRYFDYIVPCGLEGVQVTSMEKIAGQRFSIFDVYWRFVTYFADVFGDQLEEIHIENFT